MFHKLLLLLTIIIFTACTPKKVEIQTPKIQTPTPKIKKSKLDILAKEIVENCKSTSEKELNNSIIVQLTKKRIKINLNSKNDFTPIDFNLTPKAKKRLECIIPFIKAQSPLTIQIIGHASEQNVSKSQHLSDNRAITVAELFYNEGVRDEIFAKGCSDKKIKIISSESNNSRSQEIEINIYTNKSYLKNGCN